LRGTKCVPRAKINESSKPVALAVVPQECTVRTPSASHPLSDKELS
jgi:hypothetical protein